MNARQVIQCLKCRRPTRPPRARAGDYPGTVPRLGDHCKTCAEGREAVLNPEPRMSVEEIRAGLVAYLRRRRDREETMMRREYLDAYPHLARKQVTA